MEIKKVVTPNQEPETIFINESERQKANVIDEFSFTSKKVGATQKQNQHYSRLVPQTIQRMQDVLTPEEFQGFCRGNIIKYAERMRHKDEPEKEAVKIIDYAKWLLQSLRNEKVSVW